MGIRMSIYPVNDPDKWYGDDHKMYGYWAYEDVKNSFNYLAGMIFNERFHYNYRDLYEDSFIVGGFNVTLNNDQFKEFSELYLRDLESTGHDQSVIDATKEYFDILCGIDDDKHLEWE